MHFNSRETLLISTFFVSLTILVSFAVAAVVETGLSPVQTLPGKNVDFSLSVKNLGGGNVNHVELSVPQQDNLPMYLIKEVGTPVGWTYEARYAVGGPAPLKIIWSTSGSGISASNSLNFNFVATSPNAGGDYNFEWKAVDLSGQENFGTVKVTNFNPALTSLGVSVPASVSAGKEFDMTVTALDQKGSTKTDYTGAVKFSSSDPLAVLPSDYTFQASDNGAKTFKMKLKTAMEQEVKVSDGSLEKTVKINVLQGDVSSVELNLSKTTAAPNTAITLTVSSNDLYGNIRDVTNSSSFSIDREAKGKFVGNTYTTETIGKWTIAATYTRGNVRFSDGALLSVVSELPKPVPIPSSEKVSMEISSDDLVQVPFNATKLFSLTVKNTGDMDLANVSIYFTGYPDKWLSISPTVADIAKGKTQRYTITISAPEHVATADVEFVALSNGYSSDMLNASKIVKVNVTEPTPEVKSESGRVVLNRNLTYLGIAVLVAVVLIILFWALFLREEPKKKKPE